MAAGNKTIDQRAHTVTKNFAGYSGFVGNYPLNQSGKNGRPNCKAERKRREAGAITAPASRTFKRPISNGLAATNQAKPEQTQTGKRKRARLGNQ